MLELPCDPPARLSCDTCGHAADVVVVMLDGTLATACLRDRIDLPKPAEGSRRLERHFGRWVSGFISVGRLVGTALPLPCEACGQPGRVIWEVRTDEGHWETVACRGCLPPKSRSHASATVRTRARWDDAASTWRASPDGWWPRPASTQPSRGPRASAGSAAAKGRRRGQR